MSGDCGHGWGYHHFGASWPCFKCDENYLKEAYLNYGVTKKENRDLKMRLHAIEKTFYKAKLVARFGKTKIDVLSRLVKLFDPRVKLTLKEVALWMSRQDTSKGSSRSKKTSTRTSSRTKKRRSES